MEILLCCEGKYEGGAVRVGPLVSGGSNRPGILDEGRPDFIPSWPSYLLYILPLFVIVPKFFYQNFI